MTASVIAPASGVGGAGNDLTRFRTLTELAVGTLLLMLPAFLNGYPLIFPDTGQYLRAGIERSFATDRPIYYSVLVFLVNFRLSVWPIIVIQCLALAASLRVVVFALIPASRGLWLYIVFTFMAVFTSAGWNAIEIMPDAFTGLLTILLFALGWAQNGWSWRKHLFYTAAVSGTTMLHYSHLPLVAGLFVVAALIRLAQGAGWNEIRRIALVGGSVLLTTVTAFTASSLATAHEAALDPDSGIFLAARVLADGPGRDWLAETCPASGNAFCKYRNRIPNDSSEFLWNSESPLQDVTRDVGLDRTRSAAAQIVIGAITSHPGPQLAAALANSITQLRQFQPERFSPRLQNLSVNVVLRTYFPREYRQFRNSLQLTGRLPVSFIQTVYPPIVYVSAIAALILMTISLRNRDRLTVGCILMVAATLGLNSILCGALSAPENRYGSRVVWLLPLAALLGSVRLWRCRRLSDPVKVAFLKRPTESDS